MLIRLAVETVYPRNTGRKTREFISSVVGRHSIAVQYTLIHTYRQFTVPNCYLQMNNRMNDQQGSWCSSIATSLLSTPKFNPKP